ncbi:MAG TPA: FtsX-like permease family protein [Blastocatellia bacterium]|nr:FtsX-like permease family protein [Blastocatellia bacterium]
MDNLISANLLQRPARTAVSMTGVALGVILIVLFVGLARGLMNDYVKRQSNVDAELRFFPAMTNINVTAHPLMLPSGYVNAIVNGVKADPDDPAVRPKPPITGVAAVTPVGEWMRQSGVGGIGLQIVDGIDYPSFVKTTGFHLVKGRGLGETNPYEALVDGYEAQKNGLEVGSQTTLLGHNFTVVGIYDPPVLSRVKIPLKTLQELLGGPNNCSYLMIKTARPELAGDVKAALESYYPGNNIVFSRDLPAFYSRAIVPVEVFLDVVISLALVISTLVILLAMYTTITERTREIGILKSMGASKTFIVMSIEKEAVMMSALGVVFGFVISIVARYCIEATTRLKIDIEPKWVLISVAIGLLAGMAGALYPAFSAANVDPVEALSYE